MKNLAGVNNCDQFIEKELDQAGIEKLILPEKCPGEVPYGIIGNLGEVSFVRAWYYWRVNCKVPLDIANELYDNPIGQTDIRVCGYSGNIDPKQVEVNGYIRLYHIDSQEGLNLFVKTLKEHDLV